MQAAWQHAISTAGNTVEVCVVLGTLFCIGLPAPTGCLLSCNPGVLLAGQNVGDPRGQYLGGYIGFGLGYVCLVAVRSIINLLAGWQASRRIHHASMASLCLAPVSFFDTTPIGRILNRFAKVGVLLDVEACLCNQLRLPVLPRLGGVMQGLNQHECHAMSCLLISLYLLACESNTSKVWSSCHSRGHVSWLGLCAYPHATLPDHHGIRHPLLVTCKRSAVGL